MATFKCKMCGGTLEIHNNENVVECEYCGTQQTLPKLNSEKRVQLYDRANHFRRNNEFDKATGIYEQILNEDGTDAEAYWSLVLCRYGIEYVEEPKTHKRIPTVNRTQFTSIFDDNNYKSALQYADSYQKTIYEEEAKEINEIQKSILTISQKEPPFDVFICYKETDNSGNRTPDSVLAQELYYQLEQEGFKVFFSRITLENKLGAAYEPYIFAALNSAKVMVVLGTKQEYFNAVWVKNEWSRYLSLIKNGAKKILIPAYKDIDPYDLPEEFSHLQAQDMSKLGFMQDLIRGIKKLVQNDSEQAVVVKETIVTGGNTSVASLLERAFLFLEDGNWKEADVYCERVLDQDPKCAKAYLGKLMVDLRVKEQKNLKNCTEPFDSNHHYHKVVRFADDNLRLELEEYIEYIRLRNENARQKKIEKIEEKLKVLKRFISITIALACTVIVAIMLSTVITENGKYKDAILLMESGKYTEAIKAFEELNAYKDSAEKVLECKYNKALALIDHDIIQAYEILIGLEGYKDSAKKANSIYLNYQKEKLNIADVGDSIYFGAYEQDNNASNGKENIEWLVIDKEEDKVLVISKYALDCKPYNTTLEDVTWETCTLRTWLNNEFINNAFLIEEQWKIPTVTVAPVEEDLSFLLNLGNATQDKIFLLSFTEASKYFAEDYFRQCEASDYAVAQGAYMDDVQSACCWWLRSPGGSQDSAGTIGSMGEMCVDTTEVDIDNYYAVRPALWINLGP